MSDYNRCLICKEFHWSNKPCKPLYYYNIPDCHGEDEWGEVHAYSFSSAAEAASEKSDSHGDHAIIEAGGLDEIRIKDSEGTIKRFKVNAECVAQYNAYEIKPAEEGKG